MPTRSIPHVFRRNGHHYLRIVVPAALRGLVGKRELRYSLRTGYHAEACRRGALVASAVKEWLQGAVMAELKTENLGALIEQYVRDKIDELANAYTNEMKNRIQTALSAPPAMTTGRTITEIEEDLNSLLESASKDDISPVVKKADEFLKANGYQNHQDSDEFAKFCTCLVAAEGKFLRFAAAMLYKPDRVEERRTELLDFEKYMQFLEPNRVTPQIQAVPQSTNTDLLPGKASEVFETYFAEYRKNSGKNYKKEIKSSFAAFLLIIGDVELRHFTARNAISYKESLKKMPRAWGKKNEFKDMPVNEILNRNDFETLSDGSVNKHLSVISSFFEYALNHGYAKRNFFSGIQIPIQAVRAREQRDMWDDEHLKLLFAKENYPIEGPAHMFWLPIIAILTGARLGEIAQLRYCDVRSVDGIAYIDINDEDGKRIKNQQSKRNVPLNEVIVKDLNFLQFVESMRSNDKSQLFPELYGFESFPEKIASSHFSKFKQRELGIENPKVNFHSLRHNARNMVPSSVTDDNLLNDYFGWEGEGEGNTRYRKAENIITLYKNVTQKMKINFDFSALKESSYVTACSTCNVKKRKEKLKRINWTD